MFLEAGVCFSHSARHVYIYYVKQILITPRDECMPLTPQAMLRIPSPPKEVEPVSVYMHICFAKLTLFLFQLAHEEIDSLPPSAYLARRGRTHMLALEVRVPSS